MSEKEYSAIYLAPPCFGFERNWCEDNAPVDCECPNGPHPWAKFVIESELTTLRAENKLMREAVEAVRDGYKSQMKFCDIEALGYFREFVRRIDNALAQVASHD